MVSQIKRFVLLIVLTFHSFLTSAGAMAADIPRDTLKLEEALAVNIDEYPAEFQNILYNFNLENSYRQEFFAILARDTKSERLARNLHIRGSVIVAVSVRSDGEIHGLYVSRSSGDQLTDALALSMIITASPLPRPPFGMVGTMSAEVGFGQ